MTECLHLYFKQEDQLVRMNQQRTSNDGAVSIAIGIAKVHTDRNSIYF